MLIEAVKTLADEERVEAMFVKARWPNGIACSHCGSLDVITRESRNPAPFRCRDCRKYFSVKSGTMMHGSRLPLSKWALAIYLLGTSPKGISSMRLSRELGVAYRTAWHLSHRIRGAWDEVKNLGPLKFKGPVEVDETFIGGRERNKHRNRTARRRGQTWMATKTIVVGIKDRATNRVVTEVVEDTDARTLQGFVRRHTAAGAKIYTDGHGGYRGLRNHGAVEHSTGEYVRGNVHTNGIEAFWSMLKRGVMGTYHFISRKHTDRYATEFEWRHNNRPSGGREGLVEMIEKTVRGMWGRRLSWRELVDGPEPMPCPSCGR